MGDIKSQFMKAKPMNLLITQLRTSGSVRSARITKNGRLFGVADDNDEYYLIEVAVINGDRKIISAKKTGMLPGAVKSSTFSTGKPFFNIQNLCKKWFGDDNEKWKHDLQLVDSDGGTNYYEVIEEKAGDSLEKISTNGFGLSVPLEIKRETWSNEIIECIKQNNMIRFCLKDIYKYEPVLAKKYPDNHTIQDTIRRILQDLRNDGLLVFVDDNGSYRITPKFIEKYY